MMANMFFPAEDFTAISEIFEKFDGITNESRICLLCTLIDVASADSGKSSAELVSLIAEMVSEVNSELGAFQRCG